MTSKENAIILVLTLLFITNCKDKEHKHETPLPNAISNVSVYFDNVVYTNTDSFKLNLSSQSITDEGPLVSSYYTNAAGNNFTVRSLQYYISNVKLIGMDGSTFTQPDSYHLIKVDATTSKEVFTITGVPVKHYTKIMFGIGVDSVRNHDLSLKTGDLSEHEGYGWTWDTGYKFLNIDGKYNKTETTSGYFKYEIGGDNNYKTVTLDFPQHLITDEKKLTNIHLHANVMYLFNGNGSNPINISSTPLADYSLMQIISNNYGSGMFKVDHIHGAHEH